MPDSLRSDAKLPTPRLWPRRYWVAVILWSSVWTIALAAVAAIAAGFDIRDARLRDRISAQGIRTVARIWPEGTEGYRRIEPRCGRGYFRFALEYSAGTLPMHGTCDTEQALPDRTLAKTGGYAAVAYDPSDPRKVFILDSSGRVPARDTSKVWKRWMQQVALVFALFLPGTAAVQWRRRHGGTPGK